MRANYEKPWWIYVMYADGSDPRIVNSGGWSAAEPAWSPDASAIVVEAPSGIATIAADGSGMQTRVGGRVFDPDWSSDGRSLVFNKFTAPGDATSPFGTRMRIFAVTLTDGAVRQLIPDAVAPALPSYWDYQAAWSRGK